MTYVNQLFNAILKLISRNSELHCFIECIQLHAQLGAATVVTFS